MAIQIWDAQAGQYKSADLARFGGSGTLTEALVWDGTQYVKVWSATITITPQAPTFLSESPWYILPTQAGVTYTVSGTPGYGQSVTVTATPQAGYELAGQTSWSHTYGPPPSPYPLTGTFEIVNGAAISPHEVFSHTIVEPGSFTGTITVESGKADAISWRVNGGSSVTGLTRTFTGLSVGDTIEVSALGFSTLNVSGTWSLVKN